MRRTWHEAGGCDLPDAHLEQAVRVLDRVIDGLLASCAAPSLHEAAQRVTWHLYTGPNPSRTYGYHGVSPQAGPAVGITLAALEDLGLADLRYALAHEIAHEVCHPARDPWRLLDDAATTWLLTDRVEEALAHAVLEQWGFEAPPDAPFVVIDAQWALGMDLRGLAREDIFACLNGEVSRPQLARMRRRDARPTCAPPHVLQPLAVDFWLHHVGPWRASWGPAHDRLCRRVARARPQVATTRRTPRLTLAAQAVFRLLN